MMKPVLPASADDIDLSDLEFWMASRAVREGAFERLRQDRPISFHEEFEPPPNVPLPRGAGFWAVTRHADVLEVSRNAELYCSGQGTSIPDFPPEFAEFFGSMINMDDPGHKRHRNLVNRGFTPRRIAAWEKRAREVVDACMAGVREGGDFDVVADLAIPLPVTLIVEMLGVEAERRDDFKRWSAALIVGSTQIGTQINTGLFREFRDYMSKVVEQRRREPGDDLVSLLVHAEEEGGILDTVHVVGFASLMLAAGSETTTNAIGNALLALQANPEQDALVREDPERHIPALIEETLRYDPPIQLTARLATQDSELAGVRIPRGSLVAVLLASANRDPAEFEDPDRFDIDRPTPAHFGFGFGNHFCIGASLARLEGTIALEMILTRLPGLNVPGADAVERHGSFLVRGPSALPVRFDV